MRELLVLKFLGQLLHFPAFHQNKFNRIHAPGKEIGLSYSLDLLFIRPVFNDHKWISESGKQTNIIMQVLLMKTEFGVYNNLHLSTNFLAAKSYECLTRKFKGKLNPKIDFSSFEHLGIVEQLYEVF